MRSLFILSSAILLSACAGQQAVPEISAPAPAAALVAAPAPVAAAPVEKKAPQCYSGDAGKFFNVGDKTTVSGIEVICATNSDGKAGQWAAVKK